MWFYLKWSEEHLIQTCRRMFCRTTIVNPEFRIRPVDETLNDDDEFRIDFYVGDLFPLFAFDCSAESARR